MVTLKVLGIDLEISERCQQRGQMAQRVCRCFVVPDMCGFAMNVLEPEIATHILADSRYQRKVVYL